MAGNKFPYYLRPRRDLLHDTKRMMNKSVIVWTDHGPRPPRLSIGGSRSSSKPTSSAFLACMRHLEALHVSEGAIDTSIYSSYHALSEAAQHLVQLFLYFRLPAIVAVVFSPKNTVCCNSYSKIDFRERLGAYEGLHNGQHGHLFPRRNARLSTVSGLPG